MPYFNSEKIIITGSHEQFEPGLIGSSYFNYTDGNLEVKPKKEKIVNFEPQPDNNLIICFDTMQQEVAQCQAVTVIVKS